MANDPWNICRDGLAPITVAVSKVAEPEVGKLVEWFRSGADFVHSMSFDLTGVTAKNWVHAGTLKPTSTRRQMVRWWLQSNDYEADAQEFDSRLTELIDHLQEWERGAKQEAKDRESSWKAKEEAGEFLELFFIIGQTGCDALSFLEEEASDTWNYLRHLDTTAQNSVDMKNPTAKEILQAYKDATGTAAEREAAVQILIDQTQWSSFAAVKAAASKQGIKLKSLKKKVS